MPIFSHSRFESVDVELDGNTFESCAFIRCRLLYRGGPLPVFSGVGDMDNCTFAMRDGAERTLKFLELIYGIGGGEIIEGLFATIRSAGKAPR